MIVPSDTKKMNTIDKLGIGYRSTNIHTIIYAQIYISLQGVKKNSHFPISKLMIKYQIFWEGVLG